MCSSTAPSYFSEKLASKVSFEAARNRGNNWPTTYSSRMVVVDRRE
jgi:hypothetical protein